MDHLGAERVLQLARGRFYWPLMQHDITHFVTKVCSCLKQRCQNISIRAPLQPIMTTAPFELSWYPLTTYTWKEVLVDRSIFLLSLITSRVSPRPTPQGISPLEQQRTNSSTISCCALEFRLASYTTREKNLGTNCFTSYSSGVEWSIQGVHRSTHSAVGKPRDLTTPYWQCWELYPKNGSVGGMNTSLKVVHTHNCTRSESTGYPPRFLFFGGGAITSFTNWYARWTFTHLSDDGIALSCWSQRFDCNTARLHQARRSIVYVSLFVACWFAAIGAFRSSLLFRLWCSLTGPLCGWSAVVLSDRRYPSFRNFDSTISIDIIRMKSHMDSLFDPRVYQWGSRPNGKVPLFVSVLRNCGGLRTSKPYISVVFFSPFLYRSPCFPDVYFAALAWNLIDDDVLFNWFKGVFRSH